MPVHEPGEDSRGPRCEPFDLQAYLDRQYEGFTSGPTMAEVLDDLDRYRRTTMTVWLDETEPIPDMEPGWVTETIREAREADDPRELG